MFLHSCEVGKNVCILYVSERNAGWVLKANKLGCRDIDECSADTHKCNTTDDTDAANVACSNTDGSYDCICSDKYIYVADSENRTCEPLNHAPVGINITGGSVLENAADAEAASFAAIDEDTDDTFTWELLEGHRIFKLVDGNTLHTRFELDFEEIEVGYIPIKVQVTDAIGATFASFFNITIEDANDAPKNATLDGTVLAETAAAGTVVGMLSAEDEDADDEHTYTVQSPQKGFKVENDKLVYTGDSGGFVNYERANEVTIVVRAIDKAGAHVDQEIFLEITDGNDAPYFAATEYSVDENSNVGVEVVSFELGDDDMLTNKPWLKDREPQTVHLEAAADDGELGPFQLSGLTLILSSQGLDHEETSIYKFQIAVVDSDENNQAKTIDTCTVTVRDMGEPPSLVTLSSNTIEEMGDESATDVGTVIGQVVIFDEDLVIQPTITVDSPANQLFSMSTLQFKTVRGSDWPGDLKADRLYTQCTGDLLVAGQLRFNDGAIRELVILVTDGAGTEAFKFDINVTNANDRPERIWLSSPSVQENTPAGVLVSDLKTFDQDFEDTMNYTLLDDGDGAFALAGKEIVVRNQSKLDHETKGTVAITVSATDSGEPPLTGISTITIHVDDVNERPTAIKFDRDSFFETARVGSAIATVKVVDPDNVGLKSAIQSHKCTIADSTGPFRIDSRNTVRLRSASVDYERRKSYEVEVMCIDTGSPPMSLTQTLTLHVLNRNESPLFTHLSASTVPENAPSGTIVGIFTTTDPDNQGMTFHEDAQGQFTYTLSNIDGLTHCAVIPDERCMFWIDGITLRTVVPLNYELRSEHAITVEVEDSGGMKLTSKFTIAVKDTNDVPRAVTLTANRIVEGDPGAVVGTLQTEDEDIGQIHQYHIVNHHATDGSLFAIDGNTLQLAQGAEASYEQASRLIVHVRASDNGDPARYLTAQLEVVVEDINEPPSSVVVSSRLGYRNGNVLVGENDLAGGACIGKIDVIDPDNAGSTAARHQTHLCSVVDDNGAWDQTMPYFEVREDNMLCLASGIVDFESERDNRMNVNLDCSDDGVPVKSAVFNIQLEVENDNEPPRGIVIDGSDTSSESGDGKVITLISLSEDTPVGSSVATIIVEDPDNCAAARCYPWQTHTLTIEDNDFFAAKGYDLVLIQALDHATKVQHTAIVTATDTGNPVQTSDFIVVVQVSKAAATTPAVIKLTGSHTIAPSAVLGDVIGPLALINDVSNGAFKFDASKHMFVLKAVIILPQAVAAEAAPFKIHGSELRVQDSRTFRPGSSFALEISVAAKSNPLVDLVQTTIVLTTVVDNAAPKIEGLGTMASLSEDAGNETVIARFKVHDPNNQIGCGEAEGGEGEEPGKSACANLHSCNVATVACFPKDRACNSTFNLLNVWPSQEFILTPASTIDYERITTYELEISCTDDGAPPLNDVQTIIVSISDVNEGPTDFIFRNSNGEESAGIVPEGAPKGVVVGSFGSTDPEDPTGLKPITYTLVLSPHRQYPFEIHGNQLLVSGEIDYETEQQYAIQVRAWDSSSDPQPSDDVWTVIVDVEEINEAPVAVHLSCGCKSSATCMHGGGCMPVGLYGFMCLCTDGFSGRYCEVNEEMPELQFTKNGGDCLHIQPTVPIGSTLAQFNVHDYDFNQVHDVKVIGTAKSFVGVKANTLYLRAKPPRAAEVTIIAIDNGGLQVVQSFSFTVSECGADSGCSEHATCAVDDAFQAVCTCNEGFVGDGKMCGQSLCNGKLCSEEETCASNPCKNGGLCADLDTASVNSNSKEQGEEHFICSCPTGYSGIRCEATAESLCAAAGCAALNSTCLLKRYQPKRAIGAELAAVCIGAEFVVSNLDSNYEDDRQLCKRRPSDYGVSLDCNEGSRILSPLEATWPCMSHVLFGAHNENTTRISDATYLSANMFSSYEAISASSSDPDEATFKAPHAAVFDESAGTFKLAFEVRADISRMCNTRHSVSFSNSPSLHLQESSFKDNIGAVCCGILRAAIIAPSVVPTRISEPSTAGAGIGTTRTSNTNESPDNTPITDRTQSTQKDAEIKSSLKTGAGAAAAVVGILCLLIGLLVVIRKMKMADTEYDGNVNTGLSILPKTSNVLDRPKTSISKVKAPPRRSVAFVNPAYASAIGNDHGSALDNGFDQPNRLALTADDDEKGYLAVNDGDVNGGGGDDDDDEQLPGSGYLSIGEEADATSTVHIANPLFAGSPPASPPASPTSPVSPASNALKVARSQRTKRTTDIRASPAIETLASTIGTGQREQGVAQAAAPNNECSFLANCTCTNCVDYE